MFMVRFPSKAGHVDIDLQGYLVDLDDDGDVDLALGQNRRVTDMSGHWDPPAMLFAELLGDDGASVAALAVHEHEDVVWGEVPEVDGPDDRGGVRDRLCVAVEGRGERPHGVG